MKLRWRTLALRLFGFAAAALLGFYLLLPSLIERQIKLALKDAGLPGATLDVGVVGLTGLTISNLMLAEGQVRIGSIAVTYSPATLKRFSVDTIALRNATLKLGLTDDLQLDWGALANVANGSASNGEPPVRQIDIADSDLIVTWGQRDIRIPVSATLTRAHQTFALSAKARLDGQSIHSPDGSLELLGITGEISVVGAEQFFTREPIRLRIAHARIGKFQADDVKLYVDRSTVPLTIGLTLASTQLGSLVIDPFNIDLTEPILHVTAKLTDLDLGQTLPAITTELSGWGKMSGQLQLRIKAYPPYRASIDGGDVAVSPGTTLRFASQEPLRKLLGVKDSPTSLEDASEQTKQKLVEALADFRYEVLGIRFVRTDNDVVTRIQLQGVGRRDPLQAVGPLTLNIGQLNDLVNTGFVDTVLRMPQWFDKAMQRIAERSAKEGN